MQAKLYYLNGEIEFVENVEPGIKFPYKDKHFEMTDDNTNPGIVVYLEIDNTVLNRIATLGNYILDRPKINATIIVK